MEALMDTCWTLGAHMGKNRIILSFMLLLFSFHLLRYTLLLTYILLGCVSVFLFSLHPLFRVSLLPLPCISFSLAAVVDGSRGWVACLPLINR